MLSSKIELECEITKKYSESCGKTGRDDTESDGESDEDLNDDDIFAMDDFECEEMVL